MGDEDADHFIFAVQVAAQLGSELFTESIKFEDFDEEIVLRLRRHDVPESWFVRVRSLANTFANFATYTAEHGPEHNEKRRRIKARNKALRSKPG